MITIHKLKLIDRYILVQFIKSFLFSLIGLVFVFLLINFLEAMKIDTNQSKKLMYLYLLYSIPQIVIYVVPAAIMFSVTFTVSQMTNDKEFIAIFSSGISFYRSIAGIIVVSIILSFLILILQNTIVIPYNKISQKYLNDYKKNIKNIKTPKEAIFQINLKGKDSYYFIQYFDSEKKSISGGFHIFKFMSENNLELPVLMIECENAVFNNDSKKWILYKVREIEYDKDLNIKKVNFFLEKEYEFLENIDFFINPYKDPSTLSIFELKKEIELRKSLSIEFTQYEVYYYSLISFPFFCIIISIIGAITGNMGDVRSGNPLIRSLLLSTIVIFLFQITNRLGLNLGEAGVLPPIIAGWISLIIFMLFAIYLIIKHRR